MVEAGPALRRLTARDLVLFNISAVAGIRWLPAAAQAGSGSLVLWITAAFLFFGPCAKVVAALSQRFPEQGGIYPWTRRAWGDWHAFLCAWCYWLNNLFYAPGLALSGVAMATSLAPPPYDELAENARYTVAVSVAVLAGVVAANLAGLRAVRWTGAAGGTATYLAGLILIAAGGAAWLERGSATAIEIAPRLDWEKVNFWPQIAFAFGGLELSAMFGGEIRDPGRTVRVATWISGAAITAFYLLGTLAILVLIPAGEVSVLTGLTQAGRAAAGILDAAWLAPALGLLAAASAAGQLGAWMTGTARLPMLLGVEHLLPRAFGSLRFSLLFQGAVCAILLVVSQHGENLRTGYQLLVDMTVITYFIPFLYLFLAAWRFGLRLPAASGLAVTLVAIAFSFIPPGGAASGWVFFLKLVAGTGLVAGFARLRFVRVRAAIPA